MKHFAGLDVSVKETAVCIVDETGKICREIKAVSHPDDLLQVLQNRLGLWADRTRGRAALTMAL
jgi:predicted NBD/HSP70 family sugar kinase